jgi:hypothetical protein
MYTPLTGSNIVLVLLRATSMLTSAWFFRSGVVEAGCRNASQWLQVSMLGAKSLCCLLMSNVQLECFSSNREKNYFTIP